MSPDAPDEAPGRPEPSVLDAWALWASIGWAALLVLAALAQTLHWAGLEDALDLRRLFR
jgi:hypothetical protein